MASPVFWQRIYAVFWKWRKNAFASMPNVSCWQKNMLAIFFGEKLAQFAKCLYLIAQNSPG
jgi:hypothetical protein